MLQQSSWTSLHLTLHPSAIFWAARPQERPTFWKIRAEQLLCLQGF